MGLHAYCIAAPGARAPDAGIAGAPVRAVRGGGIEVWVSEHAERPAATLETIRSHDAVIRAAMTARHTPVPLRFGQWSADEAELEEAIREHADAWNALLRRFAGMVEMGVRIEPAEPGAPRAAPAVSRPGGGAGSGREYLQQLAARAHARDAEREERERRFERVRAAVAGLAKEERIGEVPEGAQHAWLAHLVLREDTEAYQHAVAALGGQLGGGRIIATGPWPPYSFST